jgi:5-methylcytosine-specific restriction endonuclease McrA
MIVRKIVQNGRWLAMMTAPPDGGRALLHTRGAACPCLHGLPWPPGADFHVHGYLDTNPTHAETDVARQQHAELRDGELRAVVRHRDRDTCRYCGQGVVWADRRSTHGGVLDHVDPHIAAGASNLVVACRGCNSRKGRRTAIAAGMTLLPVPGDQTRINGSTTGLSVVSPHTRAGRDGDGTGQARETSGAVSRVDGDPGDVGRDAAGVAGVAPDIQRDSTHPNPYLRSAINGLAPSDHAGLP